MQAPTPAAIGIDYRTTKLNIALVRGNKVAYQDEIQLGREPRIQIGLIAAAIERLQAVADHPALIVMEEPWARAEAGIRTAIALHKIPTRVETLALVAQMNVIYVAVPKWKAEVLPKGVVGSSKGKEAAIWYCERVMGVKPANHDAADAICLGVWGCQQQRIGAFA